MNRSKARRMRRKEARAAYLARLAQNNPVRFSQEWGHRVQSWEIEARRRAATLVDGDGALTPSTSALISEVEEVLVRCGAAAVAKQLKPTVQVLSNAQGKTLTIAVRTPLHRITKQEQHLSEEEARTEHVSL